MIWHICNLSLCKKTFPNIWKTGCITPLHKIGNSSDPLTVRPILILPCLGKVMEKLIHQQLYSCVDDNNLLCAQQSGFHKGYLTGNCLVNFLDEILCNTDWGAPSGVLYIDLWRAFDTVDHGILLDKLHAYGLKASAVSWFWSYLSDHLQVTKIKNTLPASQVVTCGVPQGSILGPLMFTLYVNDLPCQVVEGSSCLYANDTAILVSGLNSQEIERKLNSNLQHLAKWFADHKLSLNLSKCKYMIFGTRHQYDRIGHLSVKFVHLLQNHVAIFNT